MSPAETLGLRGISVGDYRWSMTGNQARAAAGNAMCMPVLALIFASIVPYLDGAFCYRHPGAVADLREAATKNVINKGTERKIVNTEGPPYIIAMLVRHTPAPLPHCQPQCLETTSCRRILKLSDPSVHSRSSDNLQSQVAIAKTIRQRHGYEVPPATDKPSYTLGLYNLTSNYWCHLDSGTHQRPDWPIANM